MGIHSKWDSNGNLVFYDTATTDILTISKTGNGIIVHNVYANTTGYVMQSTAGASYTTTGGGYFQLVVANGVITNITTA